MSGRLVRRACQGLVRLAAWAMPAEESDWAEAMVAEAAFIPKSAAALAYSLGCVAAALRVRAVSLLRRSRPEVKAGVVAGALFLASALMPESRSWPWFWPAAAGILLSAGPPSVRTEGGVGRCVRAGVRAGLIAAAIFGAGGALFVWGRNHLYGGPPVHERLALVAYGSAGAILLLPLCTALAYGLDRLIAGTWNGWRGVR